MPIPFDATRIDRQCRNCGQPFPVRRDSNQRYCPACPRDRRQKRPVTPAADRPLDDNQLHHAVLKLYKHTCVICGRRATKAGEIRSRQCGGTRTLDNLIAVCGECFLSGDGLPICTLEERIAKVRDRRRLDR